MPSPQAGSWLRLFRGEPGGASRIQHLLGARIEIAQHRGAVSDKASIPPCGEVAGGVARKSVCQRAAFCLPLLQPAIKHRHILMPHDAEHPPDARRAEEPCTVIDDDAVAIAKSHGADAR